MPLETIHTLLLFWSSSLQVVLSIHYMASRTGYFLNLGGNQFAFLREKKDRILAWLIILLQWHSAFVKKDKSRKKSNLAECECTWTWKFTKCQLLSTDVHSYYKSRVHSKWKAKCRVLDMINSFSAYWTKNDSHKIVHLNQPKMLSAEFART